MLGTDHHCESSHHPWPLTYKWFSCPVRTFKIYSLSTFKYRNLQYTVLLTVHPRCTWHPQVLFILQLEVYAL